MPKNAQSTTQLISFHMLARSCLKSFKLGFNSVWTSENLQMYKLDLEKTRNQRFSCQHTLDHRKNNRIPGKHQLLLHWLCMLKTFTVWITTNGGKFLKRWKYQTTLPASWENYMQVKKQQLKAFSASIEIIIWFLSFNLLMWCITLIDLQILKNPCIPGIKPRSWCMIFLICCWILFARIHGWFMSMCGKNHYNIVKQLASS